LIRALGARYDGHPDLELVDVSIVGAWGEGAGVEQLTDATREALLDCYLDTFRQTPLVLQLQDPKSTHYALARRPVGWRVDCLGNNKGVAPCYRKFPLAFRLKSATRTEVLPAEADITTWLPGDNLFDGSVTVPARLAAGDYELELGLLDPLAKVPKVRLAIEGRTEEGWYRLGPIKVDRDR
jgi:hypothetical protein